MISEVPNDNYEYPQIENLSITTEIELFPNSVPRREDFQKCTKVPKLSRCDTF